MGCGGSKFDSEAESVPARMRPLLKKRFEEMRNRRRKGAASLKDSNTGISKKELLKDGVNDYETISSPPRDSDAKNICFQEDDMKVVPEDMIMSKDIDSEPRTVVKETSVLKSVKVAPEPEKFKEQKSIKWNNCKDENKEVMPIFAAVKTVKTTVVEDFEEEDDDDEIGRLSSLAAGSLCPGSPSFRVYFFESLASMKDEDELDQDQTDKDDDSDSDKKSVEEDSLETTESRDSNADSEEKPKKKTRRIGRFRKVIPLGKTTAVKHLLKVKSCYNPGCGGHDHARLLENK